MLNNNQVALIDDIKRNGHILRKLMSKDEIKLANQLVKLGFLVKGISDDKQKTILFRVND